MAVLVQKVIPSEYAFVIHTENPMACENNDQQVYSECCVGMGEALVSDMPGQPLSFVFDKATGATEVISYPSKSQALISNGGFIFRSDSNSEDLSGFAGAGLFDSVTMSNSEELKRVAYSTEQIIKD